MYKISYKNLMYSIVNIVNIYDNFVWHVICKNTKLLCFAPETNIVLSVSYESESHPVMFNCLRPHELYSPWNSPGQNTGVDSLSLLQGIFPTQGSNPGLPHCGWILYQLSHLGSHKGSQLCFS